MTVDVAVASDENDVGDAGWVEATPIRLDPIEGKPADEAGIEAGDVVVAINGEPVLHDRDVLDVIEESGGEPMAMTLRRNGREVEVSVAAQQDEDPDGEKAWRIGAYIGPERSIT